MYWYRYRGRNPNPLLIVPEGIEILVDRGTVERYTTFNRTRRNWNMTGDKVLARVNPAFNRTRRNWNKQASKLNGCLQILLIVPEGIEISNQVFTPRLGDTFNRTRRNWNIAEVKPSGSSDTLLIVPEGIEINKKLNKMRIRQGLLIVPEGIEIS